MVSGSEVFPVPAANNPHPFTALHTGLPSSSSGEGDKDRSSPLATKKSGPSTPTTPKRKAEEVSCDFQMEMIFSDADYEKSMVLGSAGLDVPGSPRSLKGRHSLSQQLGAPQKAHS